MLNKNIQIAKSIEDYKENLKNKEKFTNSNNE